MDLEPVVFVAGDGIGGAIRDVTGSALRPSDGIVLKCGENARGAGNESAAIHSSKVAVRDTTHKAHVELFRCAILDTDPKMFLLPSLLMIGTAAGIVYLFATQLGHPRGWFGRVFMTGMLNNINRTMLDAAVQALHARAGERIADVGFGGGYAIERLIPAVKPERITGIEMSDVMLEKAKQRWGDAVDLRFADARHMPFPDGWFDAILSVNTIYFWPDPNAILRELRRVLKPGGRLVLGIRSKSAMRWMPVSWFGFGLYSSGQLRKMLTEAGFDCDIRRTAVAELTVVAIARA